MKIEHIAFWVRDLETMRSFYEKYFNGRSGELYENPAKNFRSYFLSFDGGSRIELMHRPDMTNRSQVFDDQRIGMVHLAFSVGTRKAVDELTDRLRADGYTIAGEARTTGDGYYESVILDPENNIIEIAE
ncbi:MAG TPA: VOC family protein [Phnomibacter sp.]|nr:VOC family protein [Phnomibacter sp.]